MDLLSSWPWQILLLTIIKIILVHHLTNLLYLHNIKVCLIRLTAYSQVNYPFQKMLHLFINLILSSLFEYPICIAAVISSHSLLSTVYSPIHRLYPLSTYFTPLSTYFFSYPQILFPYPHILLPYPPILFSYPQVHPLTSVWIRV